MTLVSKIKVKMDSLLEQKNPIGIRHATSEIFLIICVRRRYDPQTAKTSL